MSCNSTRVTRARQHGEAGSQGRGRGGRPREQRTRHRRRGQGDCDLRATLEDSLSFSNRAMWAGAAPQGERTQSRPAALEATVGGGGGESLAKNKGGLTSDSPSAALDSGKGQKYFPSCVNLDTRGNCTNLEFETQPIASQAGQQDDSTFEHGSGSPGSLPASCSVRKWIRRCSRNTKAEFKKGTSRGVSNQAAEAAQTPGGNSGGSV